MFAQCQIREFDGRARLVSERGVDPVMFSKEMVSVIYILTQNFDIVYILYRTGLK